MSSSECDGFAYDPAKVEDQVQFLARTFTSKTLEVALVAQPERARLF
jgi:hypothetical protein